MEPSYNLNQYRHPIIKVWWLSAELYNEFEDYDFPLLVHRPAAEELW